MNEQQIRLKLSRLPEARLIRVAIEAQGVAEGIVTKEDAVTVLTARGFKKTDVAQINATAKALGVTIVAVGIGYTEVEELYTNAVNVQSITDLAGQAFNALLKAVQ